MAMCFKTLNFFLRAQFTRILSFVVAAPFITIALMIAHAQQCSNIPSLYEDPRPFLAAIEAERPKQVLNVKATGISVPHHLLAADLIARGFWVASGNMFDRIILLSPDHFNKSRRPLATTRQNIDTPLGTVRNDEVATGLLLSNSALFDENDLFKKEHGIAALLPFVRHFFPDARIVPIVVSYSSTRSDWDAAVAMLEKLIEPSTLIVQSTDYSHYLTQPIAVSRDQETINIIAANDIDLVSRLRQPDHLDSKGSQYIQMRLQTDAKKAHGIVIANRNSAEYSAIGTKTTSYIVTVYSHEREDGAKLRYDDQEVVYIGGDTFIGRWLTQPLADPEVARQVEAKILDITKGAPIILNLEGILLDEPPGGINFDMHVMHASLATPILKALNVRVVGLANNHSYDLGRNGLDETVTILKRAGIKPLRHLQVLNFDRLGLVAVNFIGPNDHRGYPVTKALTDLQTLCRLSARSPLVALVHWGEEYTHAARPEDYAAASALHTCGVNAVIGAHSHQAATNVESLQGGEYQVVFSLGNLLFDQKSDRASSALLELRLFKQGTFATRLVPLANLFELAAGALAEKAREKPPSQGAD